MNIFSFVDFNSTFFSRVCALFVSLLKSTKCDRSNNFGQTIDQIRIGIHNIGCGVNNIEKALV